MRTGFIDQDLTIDHPLELDFSLPWAAPLAAGLSTDRATGRWAGTDHQQPRSNVASLLGVPLLEGDLARYDEMEKSLDSVTVVGPARYPEYISELQLNRLPLLSSHRASEVRLTEAIDWRHSRNLRTISSPLGSASRPPIFGGCRMSRPRSGNGSSG
jgi:hypothetical protein